MSEQSNQTSTHVLTTSCHYYVSFPYWNRAAAILRVMRVLLTILAHKNLFASTTMMSFSRFTVALTLIVGIATLSVAPTANAFVTKASSPVARSLELGVFGKKEPAEDLSFIETRDMTREEMLELNKKNEDIMNMELQAMTGFSLVLSLPILYLCWVAFFSD